MGQGNAAGKNIVGKIKSKCMEAKCGLEYHEDKGDVLAMRIEATRVGIKDAPALMFVDPPFTDSEYSAQELALTTTYSAYQRGGEAQKGPYETQLANSILMMDTTANYVDGVAKGNVLIIAQAAYKPVNSGRVAAVKPTQAQHVVVARDVADGEMTAECESYGLDFKYGCIVSDMPLPTTIFINAAGQVKIPGGTLATLIIDLNQERKKQFMGLTSGVMYYFYFYVVNAAGVSTLSIVKSLRCG